MQSQGSPAAPGNPGLRCVTPIGVIMPSPAGFDFVASDCLLKCVDTNGLLTEPQALTEGLLKREETCGRPHRRGQETHAELAESRPSVARIVSQACERLRT